MWRGQDKAKVSSLWLCVKAKQLAQHSGTWEGPNPIITPSHPRCRMSLKESSWTSQSKTEQDLQTLWPSCGPVLSSVHMVERKQADWGCHCWQGKGNLQGLSEKNDAAWVVYSKDHLYLLLCRGGCSSCGGQFHNSSMVQGTTVPDWQI